VESTRLVDVDILEENKMRRLPLVELPVRAARMRGPGCE
jgi:hypothetical protein